MADGGVVLAMENDVLRDVLEAAVRERGIAVDAPAEGTLAMLATSRPVLIVLDLSLGQAFEIVAQVATLPALTRPVVIVIGTHETASDLDPEVVQVVIRKPFEVEPIADVIASCVRSTAAGRPPLRPQPSNCFGVANEVDY